MVTQLFTFAALADFDAGRIREAIDLELNRARLDCQDRPNLKAARKVQLTIILEPEADESGRLVEVEVGFDVQAKFPKRASRNYSMDASRGCLVFNEMSPDDIRQMSLDQAGPKEAVHAG